MHVLSLTCSSQYDPVPDSRLLPMQILLFLWGRQLCARIWCIRQPDCYYSLCECNISWILLCSLMLRIAKAHRWSDFSEMRVLQLFVFREGCDRDRRRKMPIKWNHLQRRWGFCQAVGERWNNEKFRIFLRFLLQWTVCVISGRYHTKLKPMSWC